MIRKGRKSGEAPRAPRRLPAPRSAQDPKQAVYVRADDRKIQICVEVHKEEVASAIWEDLTKTAKKGKYAVKAACERFVHKAGVKNVSDGRAALKDDKCWKEDADGECFQFFCKTPEKHFDTALSISDGLHGGTREVRTRCFVQTGVRSKHHDFTVIWLDSGFNYVNALAKAKKSQRTRKGTDKTCVRMGGLLPERRGGIQEGRSGSTKAHWGSRGRHGEGCRLLGGAGVPI